MKYESPEIEVIVFKVADVITTSVPVTPGGDDGFDPGDGGIGNGDAM